MTRAMILRIGAGEMTRTLFLIGLFRGVDTATIFELNNRVYHWLGGATKGITYSQG